MTKVDIFSGFLGAGKTTLIKKLIKEAYQGEKLVIIENEFGKIGIDSGFLREAGIEITEMNSGCICCSLVGDFGKALGEVMERFSPDRIIIEPSGVGKLSDVIKAVRDAGIKDMEPNAYVTVIDALKCKMYMKNFEEFYRNQIEFASTVILSRTAGISEAKLSECVEIVREMNSDASLIVADWEDIDGKAILDTIEKRNTIEDELKAMLAEHEVHSCGDDCSCHEHHHDHGDDCSCHEHHHDHGDDCSCHEHHHDHGDDCSCHEHHHDHGDDCSCHEHQHDHGDDCSCHEHHHDHGDDCSCHEHHHDHGDDCSCHEHHHDHGDNCSCHEHHHDHGDDCSCHEHHHGSGECDDPNCGCHSHRDHHADEVFTSWGIETAAAYSEKALSDCLDSLDSGAYGMILRAKGIVRSDGGAWLHFDYVPGEKSIRYGAAEAIGKLCVIGAGLNKAAIERLLTVNG